MLATLFAAITALGAQAKVWLPGNPVPITAQVFCVLLAGGLLGSRLGAISVIEYLAIGTLGLPVFAGVAPGLAAWAGPTAGYLIGFVAAAWAIGRLCETRGWPRQRTCLAAMALGVVIIHVAGAAWLAAWLSVTTHISAGAALARAWALGIVPFLPFDALKAFAASQLVWLVARRADRAEGIPRRAQDDNARERKA
jgi:biotin transport system substrate-specific component